MAFYWVNLGATLSKDVLNGKIWNYASHEENTQSKNFKYSSFKDDETILFDTDNIDLLKELGVDTTKRLKTVYEGNKKYLAHHRDSFYKTAAAPTEPRSDR